MPALCPTTKFDVLAAGRLRVPDGVSEPGAGGHRDEDCRLASSRGSYILNGAGLAIDIDVLGLPPGPLNCLRRSSLFQLLPVRPNLSLRGGEGTSYVHPALFRRGSSRDELEPTGSEYSLSGPVRDIHSMTRSIVEFDRTDSPGCRWLRSFDLVDFDGFHIPYPGSDRLDADRIISRVLPFDSSSQISCVRRRREAKWTSNFTSTLAPGANFRLMRRSLRPALYLLLRAAQRGLGPVMVNVTLVAGEPASGSVE